LVLYIYMKPFYIIILLLLPLFWGCDSLRNFHFREGRTQHIQEAPASVNKDTLIIFQPIIAMPNDMKLPPQASAVYSRAFGDRLDEFLTERKQPHLMVRGQFVNAEEIRDAIAMMRNVDYNKYSFESKPPFIRGFKVPPDKPALVIYHELNFRMEMTPNEQIWDPANPSISNILFDKVVDIRSHAMLIHHNEIVYYRNNRVEFDRLKSVKKHHKVRKVYSRILNDLYSGK
jgi:hypothetical protein